MSRFTRLACVAAVVGAALAPAAGAAVYQHSPGLNASSAPQAAYIHSPGANPQAYLTGLGVGTQATYAHSPGLNPYRYLEAFSPSTTPAQVSTGSSFDWRDAALGAGAFAALLLVAGTAFAVRRIGTRRLAV